MAVLFDDPPVLKEASQILILIYFFDSRTPAQ